MTRSPDLKAQDYLFAGGRLVCRLDWLQGTVGFSTIVKFYDLVQQIAFLLADEISWDDGTLNRGKKFAESGHSTKGVKFAWNPPSAEAAGEGWISIPGAALGSVAVVVWRDLCHELEAYGFKATRFDSAVDDLSKSIPPEQLLECARAGNFAGFRHRPVGKSTATYWFYGSPYIDADGNQKESLTIGFGSKSSDKSLIYYNKTAESDGEIDSNRFEARHNDEQAQQRFKYLCKAFREKTIDECLRLIGSFMIGSIDFIDRSQGDRLARHPRFSWWSELIEALGDCSPPVPRPMPSIERSISWAQRQWETTLAVVREVCGNEKLMDFAQRLLISGLRRLEPHHAAIIRRAKREQFDIDEFLTFIENSS
jgi:hypothetical protein